MGVEFPVLQPAYHAFYLLLHMLQHFLRAGFGLKLLCDWVVFWEKGYGSGVEERFFSMAEECRVMGFARLVTAVCVKYLGLSGEKVPLLLCRFDWEAEAANLEAFLTESSGSGGVRQVKCRPYGGAAGNRLAGLLPGISSSDVAHLSRGRALPHSASGVVGDDVLRFCIPQR